MTGQPSTVLIVGGTGKTGRRLADHLTARGHRVRIGSRSAAQPFDWADEAGWEPLLRGVDGLYIAHHDNTHPDAGTQIGRLSQYALDRGVRRQVLLSGRADEGFMDAVESGMKAAGADWTILRPAWFMQNFSEMFFLEAVMAGEIVLPLDDGATEPFIDIADVAAVAAEALFNDRHNGKTYELTGPQQHGFREAAATMTKAIGRTITFTPITLDTFRESLRAEGLPEEYAYTYSGIADGGLAYLTDDVQRVLGRKPQRFEAFARETAATGVWDE